MRACRRSKNGNTVHGPASHPLGSWDEAHAADPRHTLQPTCVTFSFGCWRSNRLDVGRGPKNSGDAEARPFGTGTWMTPRNMLLPHPCYSTKFRHSRSHRTSVIMEIRQIVLTPLVLPFKVTQGHWHRKSLIDYLWLPISVP